VRNRDEMLLLMAVKVHWRAATGSGHGFDNRLCPICIGAGKAHCNPFTGSPFVPGAYAGSIFQIGKHTIGNRRPF
jgi:hypothetical protein